MNFDSKPIDTSHIQLEPGLEGLVEMLAKNAHDVWARQRIAEGWTHGPKRDDRRRQHPCLVPYEELIDSEKEYDRITAVETLKVIQNLGYDLVPPEKISKPRKILKSTSSRLVDQIASLELQTLIKLWHEHVPANWSRYPELYKVVGDRMLRLGEPLLAYDVISEGAKNSPINVRLKQLMALALARSGATRSAQDEIRKLYDLGHYDEETLGILARTHKDSWQQAATRADQTRHLRLAHKFYAQAYNLHGGCYSGINAATLALLLGKKDRASDLARRVRQSCLKDLNRLPSGTTERYWSLATLGEAALILGQWSEAEDRYSEAAENGRHQFAELASTRRNARLILGYLGRDAATIERCLQIPRVVVFTGHRVDSPKRPSPRFPPQLESAVRDAIRRRLKRVNAGFGFASAAAGSDILFLEAMIDRGAETHVVLPYNQKQFKKDSVRIPGANWGARFELVWKNAFERVIASEERLGDGGASFQYGNSLIQGLAQMKARQLETELVPMAVWNREPSYQAGGTASVIEQWKSLEGVEIIDLDKILKRECPNLVTVSRPSATSVKKSRQPVEIRTSLMAMLFADVVRFSKLSDRQIPIFMKQVLGCIADLLTSSRYAPVLKNTWGDGLYFVFRSVRDAGMLSLELCEELTRRDWKAMGLPDGIKMRFALHAGPVYSCLDPVLNQMTYVGKNVTLTARLEPKTPEGQVYATREFAALATAQGVREFTCDYVGRTVLPKDSGVLPTFLIRRAT